MRRSILIALVPCLAFAAVVASTSGRPRGPLHRCGFRPWHGLSQQHEFSYGLGGRFGYKIAFARSPVWLLPEIGGHFMVGPDAQAGNVFGGAGLGLDGIVQPNVFAHLGLGFIGNSLLGPSTDVGVGVDCGSHASSASAWPWPTTP